MQTNESAENYLETILILSKSHPVVRSVDVASELGFKKSSVSVAMKKLRETDQITVSPEGYLYLTETGRATAEKIYERQRVPPDDLVEVFHCRCFIRFNLSPPTSSPHGSCLRAPFRRS